MTLTISNRPPQPAPCPTEDCNGVIHPTCRDCGARPDEQCGCEAGWVYADQCRRCDHADEDEQDARERWNDYRYGVGNW